MLRRSVSRIAVNDTSLPRFLILIYLAVRIAGRMVCVGTLSPENVMNMKRGIRKRLTIVFSYGGQREDLEELLDLMGRKIITPQTEEGKLEDFPRWLEDLCDGNVKARVALVPK